MTGFPPDPVDGASVVLLRRDAVLLVERARPPFRGLWSFPGGRRGAGESAEGAARRELREETGLTAGDLLDLGPFRPDGGSAFTIRVFAGFAPDGEPQAGDDAACAEFVRFSHVLDRRNTPGAVGWIARAIGATANLPGGLR